MTALAITALFTIAAFLSVTVIMNEYVRGRTAYRELLERMDDA